MRCSAAGGCIDEASCGADEDCEAGHICTPGGCTLGCEERGCLGHQVCGAHGRCVTPPPDGGIGEEVCGGSTFSATRRPANVLFLLDDSGSMSEPISSRATKWSAATSAVRAVATAAQDVVRFGLVRFPGQGTDCLVSVVDVPVATQSAGDIAAALRRPPRGPTPMASALQLAATVPQLAEKDVPALVMLITDGYETCEGDPVAATRDLHDAGVRTFAVGFGRGVIPSRLTEIALAGGTARAGSTKYYQADTARQLLTALDSVTASALECDFDLEDVPPDLERLHVFVNGKVAPYDSSGVEGWRYDEVNNRITFHGNLCMQVKASVSAKVSILWGCPPLETQGSSGSTDGGLKSQ